MSIRLSCGITVPDAVLSPMEGVCCPSFVSAVSRLGLADFWMTPFISVNPQSVPSVRILKKRLESFAATGSPVIPQIMGKEIAPVLRCAELLEECGYHALNLNFCCPSPRVTSHGGGSFLLSEPETVQRITGALHTRFPELSLSVKLRAGWETENSSGIVRAVCDSGAEWILFHFRTGKELYSPVPDGLKRVEKAVKAAGSVPVYGNGDIHSVEDMQKFVSCGCSGVAVGRGLLRDPELLLTLNGLKSRGITRERFFMEMSSSGVPVSLIRKLQRHGGVLSGGER